MKRYIWQKKLDEIVYTVTNPRSQIKHSCLLFAKAKDKITDNSIKKMFEAFRNSDVCRVTGKTPLDTRHLSLLRWLIIHPHILLRPGKTSNEN